MRPAGDDDGRIFELVASGDLRSVERYPPSELKSVTDKNGSTLLHHAAGSGRDGVCRHLLERCGLGVGDRGRDSGRTALHWAARNGHTSTCRMLVEEFGAEVDSLAKGQVTPLQLAVWRCHVGTSKFLVRVLGADPHFPNSWGCGIGHWLGKSPIYDEEDEENGSEAPASRLLEACEWLFGSCGVDFDRPNHHGQRPLHKAAYAGNLAVARYLVEHCGIVDSARDDDGNTAADCAERGRKWSLARWLRRHASPPVRDAIACLGFATTAAAGGRPPDPDRIRRSYLRLARAWHPDRVGSSPPGGGGDGSGGSSTARRWDDIHRSYRLLIGWWEDPPDVFDSKIRWSCRNAKLLEHGRLCWIPSWHEERERERDLPKSDGNGATDDGNDDAPEASTTTSDDKRLRDFEARLVRMLSGDSSFKESGLALSRLRKEYEKNWRAPVPEPREFGCRKLGYLLETRCPGILVEKASGPKQQARIRLADATARR